MVQERLEDVLHEAFTELTLHGDIYLADFAESLSPGLGRGPVKALFTLRRLGPLRVKELAVQLRLDSTTVSRHVDDLERRGKLRDGLQDWSPSDRSTWAASRSPRSRRTASSSCSASPPRRSRPSWRSRFPRERVA